MLLVQSITVVLMMVEFVLVLLMSLVLNVILVKLVGMVFHLVKVRYIFVIYFKYFYITFEIYLQNVNVMQLVQ